MSCPFVRFRADPRWIAGRRPGQVRPWSHSTGRHGAPAAGRKWTAMPWTTCSSRKPRTSKPAEATTPLRSPGIRSKPTPTRFFSLAMDLLFHPKFNQQKLRLAQQQEATGIVRRNDDEGADRRTRSREAWSMAQTAPTRASRNCRPSARSQLPTSGVARQLHRRQADHQHQRRFRSRGHGSQTARGI